MSELHATTILAVRRGGVTALAGDGQVTFGQAVLKQKAVKVRRLEGGVLAGFAGSVADAFTLFEKFEEELKRARGNLQRAAVETVKLWRTDRVLRRLEAMMVVADARQMLLLSGSGEVVSPDEPVVAVGSGAPYALAAAKALLRHTEMPAPEIARQALAIAAEADIYSGGEVTVLTVEAEG